jgi:hypothetical protein
MELAMQAKLACDVKNITNKKTGTKAPVFF